MLDTKKFGSVHVGRQGTEPEGTRNKLERGSCKPSKVERQAQLSPEQQDFSPIGRQQKSVAKSIASLVNG